MIRTITVSGGDLFKVAAIELGDATQWIRIAQMNFLVDPRLYGLVTLKIPEIDMTQTGGILPAS